MSEADVERVRKFEGVRDQIVDHLVGVGVKNLDVKNLALLEKTITTGVKIVQDQQELVMKQQSSASENDQRDRVTAFILAKREQGNILAKQIREGTAEGGGAALPQVAQRTLLPNEGAQGQFQVGFDVLSGQKPFVPAENVIEREPLPVVPPN